MKKSRGNFAAVLFCAGLLALYAATAHFAWLGKCATYDEPQHFVSSWLAVHDADYYLNSEDPALWKYYVAAGTDADDLPVDLSLPRHTEGAYSFAALYQQAHVDPVGLINAARARMILLTMILGAMVGWWAWRLAGPVAAVVAVAFLCMDPNFLAHGAVVKDDVPMALAFVALMGSIWLVGERGSVWRIGVMCVLLGAGMNVKFSGILGIPMVGGALAIRAMLPQPWAVIGKNLATRAGRVFAGAIVFAASLFVSYVTIWACYDFRFVPAMDGHTLMDVGVFNRIVAEREVVIAHGSPMHPLPGEVAEWEADWHPHGVTKFVDWMSDHHFLPQAWLMGFLFTYGTSLYRPTFFCGELGIMGWWYYFPMAMAFKTPLATIGAILLAGMSVIWWQNGADKKGKLNWALVGAIAVVAVAIPILLFPFFHAGLREYLPNYSRVILGLFLAALGGVAFWAVRARIADLWPLVVTAVCPAFYMAVAMHSHLNLGIRHMLPVYPFLFIFVGVAAANVWRRWPRTAGILIAVFILGLASETFAAYPDYIPFFNVAVGGSRGGVHLLSDSNIDWGQELPDLAKWQQANRGRPLYLLYFGFADPGYYKINYTEFGEGSIAMARRREARFPAVFAISAVALQGAYLEPQRSEMLEPFRHVQPIGVLGGSLYLFDTPALTGRKP